MTPGMSIRTDRRRPRLLACCRAVLVFNHPSYVDAAGTSVLRGSCPSICCTPLAAAAVHGKCVAMSALRCFPWCTSRVGLETVAFCPSAAEQSDACAGPALHWFTMHCCLLCAVMATFFTPSGVSKAGVASIPFIGLFGVALQVWLGCYHAHCSLQIPSCCMRLQRLAAGLDLPISKISPWAMQCLPPRNIPSYHKHTLPANPPPFHSCSLWSAAAAATAATSTCCAGMRCRPLPSGPPTAGALVGAAFALWHRLLACLALMCWCA